MRFVGRRGAALTFMAAAYLLGFLLIGAAANVEMIITGRFFGGIGLGMTLSITPVYLVEVTEINIRGMLGVVPPLLTQVTYSLFIHCFCSISLFLRLVCLPPM